MHSQLVITHTHFVSRNSPVGYQVVEPLFQVEKLRQKYAIDFDVDSAQVM